MSKPPITTTINKTESDRRLLELADVIERQADIKFNMAQWSQALPGFLKKDGPQICKTAGCIAGSAVAHWAPDRWLAFIASNEAGRFDISQVARDLLGLDYATAFNMFIPRFPVNRNRVTPKAAAKMLRTYVATGDIKWPKSTHYKRNDGIR